MKKKNGNKENKEEWVGKGEKCKNREIYFIWLDLAWRIASPLVILILLAIFLDKHFQTEPIFILFAIFIAMPGSFYLIYIKYKGITQKGKKIDN